VVPEAKATVLVAGGAPVITPSKLKDVIPEVDVKV
jgi:hypothetical protein